MVTLLVGYATHVNTNPASFWSSSKKLPSLWSTLPPSIFPAQEEQAPARHEYGKSMLASSAASRMYTSSGHSIVSVPEGVLSVTVYVAMQVTRPLRQRRDCKPKALATDTEEDFTGVATLRDATVGTTFVVVIAAAAMAANELQTSCKLKGGRQIKRRVASQTTGIGGNERVAHESE